MHCRLRRPALRRPARTLKRAGAEDTDPTDPGPLVGHWEAGSIEFTVSRLAEGLVARFPGVDDRFQARIEPVTGADFVMVGGPFPGAILARAANGEWSLGGHLPLRQLDREARGPAGGRWPAPEAAFTPEEDSIFARLWATICRHRPLLTAVDQPVGRFVQWLEAQDVAIFHGSNNPAISELLPRRTSMELRNDAGRGNLGAVYGTQARLLAMWFAVVDRARLEGSIRSSVTTFHSTDGDVADLYDFSVSDHLVREHPFTTGSLYVLARAPFEQLPWFPGGPPSPEWVSPEAVSPLTRLVIAPEDFPFLSRVGGHDDSAILEMERVADEVYSATLSARGVDGGIEIVTSAHRSAAERLVELSAHFYPDVTRVICEHTHGLAITMRGPAAFEHGLRERFAEWLAG